jgi:hypothetical protein
MDFLILSTEYGVTAYNRTITHLLRRRKQANANVLLLRAEKCTIQGKLTPTNLYFETEIRVRKPKIHNGCKNMSRFLWT